MLASRNPTRDGSVEQDYNTALRIHSLLTVHAIDETQAATLYETFNCSPPEDTKSIRMRQMYDAWADEQINTLFLVKVSHILRVYTPAAWCIRLALRGVEQMSGGIWVFSSSSSTIGARGAVNDVARRFLGHLSTFKTAYECQYLTLQQYNEIVQFICKPLGLDATIHLYTSNFAPAQHAPNESDAARCKKLFDGILKNQTTIINSAHFKWGDKNDAIRAIESIWKIPRFTQHITPAETKSLSRHPTDDLCDGLSNYPIVFCTNFESFNLSHQRVLCIEELKAGTLVGLQANIAIDWLYSNRRTRNPKDLEARRYLEDEMQIYGRLREQVPLNERDDIIQIHKRIKKWL